MQKKKEAPRLIETEIMKRSCIARWDKLMEKSASRIKSVRKIAKIRQGKVHVTRRKARNNRKVSAKVLKTTTRDMEIVYRSNVNKMIRMQAIYTKCKSKERGP